MQLRPRSGRRRNRSVQAVKPHISVLSGPDCEELFSSLKTEVHIALAVSGGSDSMAILRLAHKWAEKNHVTLTALTVNHGLRAEAFAEAEQVAQWCAALSINHCTLNWTAEKPKTGLQAKARVARYDLMAQWCQAHGVNWLLTAHTLDDQAETVAMRQARTQTDDSLAGIWLVSKWQETRLLRPLLDCRREALRIYLKTMEQPWIDDPSNEDERFERVRVRKRLACDPTKSRDLADVATVASVAVLRLEALASAWIFEYLEVFPEGYGSIPRDAFSRCEVSVQKRLIQKLVGLFGSVGAVDPHELAQVAEWIGRGETTRRTLGGAVIAGRKHTLVFGREPGRISPLVAVVPETGKMLWDGRFEILARPGTQVVAAAAVTNMVRRKTLPAFVQKALPAFLTDNGEVEIAFSGEKSERSAKFMHRLR